MSWYCTTQEAQDQLKECENNQCSGCNKCVWIEMSANTMIGNGAVKIEQHPLY